MISKPGASFNRQMTAARLPPRATGAVVSSHPRAACKLACRRCRGGGHEDGMAGWIVSMRNAGARHNPDELAGDRPDAAERATRGAAGRGQGVRPASIPGQPDLD